MIGPPRAAKLGASRTLNGGCDNPAAEVDTGFDAIGDSIAQRSPIMTLKSEIEALANTFADGVLAALRNASLEDLLEGRVSPAAKSAPARTTTATSGPRKTNGGRGRRSASDIAHVEGVIVAKLREHRAGLRSEQLQKVLKLSKAEIVGPIASALAARTIVKTGEKRATTYFAAK